MIGSLRGSLGAVLGSGEVIVDVGGVGYRVQVTPATVGALRAAQGEGVGAGSNGTGGAVEVFLHVHTHVREDALVLYGFRQADERRCFEALLGAHGVGPSLALAVLSALSPVVLVNAVAEEDVVTLCSVPGIGRKTAARLLIDLKSRLEVPELSGELGGGGAGGGPLAQTSRVEARAALAELGYGPDEIRGALDGVRDELPVEELLRRALQELAAR